ncbi:MAG: PQQ-binding-like beta-propeller repeat protein [Planctomycetota bacterium]
MIFSRVFFGHAFGRRIVSIALFLVMATDLAAQPDSTSTGPTRFRGEAGQGVYPNCRVKIPWSDEKVTKIDLPGKGNGSPVIWKDRAYLMAADDTDATRTIVAIDLPKNQIAWKKSYPSIRHKLHAFSTYASTTPCVDATGLYVAWGDPEHVLVKRFSHDGDEIWSRDFGRYVSQHGFGTSPMLIDGLLILLDSQDAEELEPGVEPGEDRMLALNTETGAIVWETSLPTRRVCYGLPAVRVLDNGQKELVGATTALGIFGMDLKTGQVRWNHECFKQRVCASTLLVGPLAIASHGSGGGRDNLLVAYDIDKQEERFRINRAAPYVPTPVATNDLLFLWSDAGIVTCLRVSDGTVRWSERIGGNFFSSPVLVGDRLVNTSDTGVVTVLAASEGFRELGSLATEAVIRSTIVATDDLILLRTDEQLWVIR